MSPSITVLVTGSSGFIASHVVKAFATKGYYVRCTVRSQARADEMKITHKPYVDKLSFIIVPDMAVDGAFDQAVTGVEGVIHTAAPFMLSGVTDVEEKLLKPIINGTQNLLRSVSTKGNLVKRVIILSSFAAVFDPLQGPRVGYTYTEEDWNPSTYEAAVHANHTGFSYCAAKALSEKAAWDSANAQSNYTLSTLCPPMVYGPILPHSQSLSSLNESSSQIYALCNGTLDSPPPTTLYGYVDVRDVAAAHVQAFENKEHGRFIIAKGGYSYQRFCDIIRSELPDHRDRTPVGTTGEPLPEAFVMDNSKSQKILGIKYHDMKDTVIDTVNSFVQVDKT